MTNWVCTDIHGYYDVYEQINNFIAPDDEVYFLGDAIDRGPDPYKTMKAIRENPRWHYYLGNHENMLKNALQEYLDAKRAHLPDYKFNNWSYSICLKNGAMYKGRSTTYRDITSQGDEAVENWIDFFENQTYLYSVMTGKDNFIIHLSHAGTSTPGVCQLNDEAEKNFIWDRTHLYENVEKGYQRNISIHGHTPISYVQDMIHGERLGTCQNDEPIFYQKNKLCIDSGIYFTGKLYLVNLDTLTLKNIEYYTFETKEDLYGKR